MCRVCVLATPRRGSHSRHLFDVCIAQCFTYGGRRCDESVYLAAMGLRPGSTVEVQRRLRGGGGDGGATGAESRVSYLEMYMSKKPDKVQSQAASP